MLSSLYMVYMTRLNKEWIGNTTIKYGTESILIQFYIERSREKKYVAFRLGDSVSLI